MIAIDNPPAFPSVCLDDPGHPASIPGMTLLDWFAGHALAGLSVGGKGEISKFAIDAYHIAEAMLAERNRRQS